MYYFNHVAQDLTHYLKYNYDLLNTVKSTLNIPVSHSKVAQQKY